MSNKIVIDRAVAKQVLDALDHHVWGGTGSQLKSIRSARNSIRAALAQQDAQAVPLVTEQMIAAGQYAWMTADGVDPVRVFSAMLNAAPTPPAQQDAQAVPHEQISDGEFDADKRLMELADKIDRAQNWRLSGIDQRDRLTQEQQDRVIAGVMLRRYADLMAPDSWRLFPPKRLGIGITSFRASTLEKVVEMASRHSSLNAAPTPPAQQDAQAVAHGWVSDCSLHPKGGWKVTAHFDVPIKVGTRLNVGGA